MFNKSLMNLHYVPGTVGKLGKAVGKSKRAIRKRESTHSKNKIKEEIIK